MKFLEMKEKALSVFLSTAFGLLAVCAGQITVRHDTRSWYEARETCRKQAILNSCDLITKARLHEQWSNLGVTGDYGLWVGGQHFSHWFWHQGNSEKLALFEDYGCRKLTVAESKLESPLHNAPAQCYRVCENSAFVYLQGKNCYCSSMLEGEPASRDKCDLSCDGSDDKCGGENGYFSAYSIPGDIRFEDVQASQNCAVGRLRENVVYVESTSCRGYHHYFCLSDKLTSEILPRSDQYDTAVSKCKTRHASSLLSLPSSSLGGAGQLLSDLKALSDKMTGSAPTTFWLPLQREVKAVWVDGREGEEGGEFGSCVAATPRTAGYRLTDLPCSESLGSICDCGGTSIDNDSGDKDIKKTISSKATAIAVVVVMFVLVVAIALPILFIVKRRMAAKRELERLDRERWGHGDNPLYTRKWPTEPGNPAYKTQEE